MSKPDLSETSRSKILAPSGLRTSNPPLEIGSMIHLPDAVEVVSETDPWTKKLTILRSNHIQVPRSWDEVSAVHRSRGFTPEKVEELRLLVELPLYEAVAMLFSAGIQTTESNAHFEPFEDETHIALVIVWDSLTLEQKNAALLLCRRQPDRWSILPQAMNPDGFSALVLSWKIAKDQSSPRAVRMYVNHAVRQLIAGRMSIRP